MEVRVTIGNKTWVVPSNAVSSLIAWLNSNAVELGGTRQEVREINNGAHSDPRQLIME